MEAGHALEMVGVAGDELDPMLKGRRGNPEVAVANAFPALAQLSGE